MEFTIFNSENSPHAKVKAVKKARPDRQTVTAMQIYVSLPITGYCEAERRERADYIKTELCKHYPDACVMTPFDLAERPMADTPTYGDYLGMDITFIIDDADVVCFDDLPWSTESRGVRLEYAAATLYGKACIFFKYLSGDGHPGR